MIAHSAKQQAAPALKVVGASPLVAFLDNTGEFLAGVLGGGNAVEHRRRPHRGAAR